MITLDILVPIAAKGALVLLLSAIVAMLLLNRSAAFRHMAWAGGLFALLILPVLSLALPDLPIGIVPSADRRIGGSAEAPVVSAETPVASAETPVIAAPADAPFPPSSAEPPIRRSA